MHNKKAVSCERSARSEGLLKRLGLSVLAAMLLVPVFTVMRLLAQPESVLAASACGAPSYDPATDREVFLWKDCGTDQWHVRFTAGSGYIQYTGTVESDQAFSSVVPVGIESGDLLDYTSDPATISYRLGMVPPWEDGFDFTYPAGATVCFGVDSPAGSQVLVGADRTPVNVPFDVETLGPCNPPQPTLSIGDVSVAEDAGTALFTVHLTPTSSQPVTVDYATVDGSAVAGDDYVATSGGVTFDAGQTSRPVAVTIVDDTVPDGDETFTVELSNPVNALLGDASATGTIIDNEVTVCGAPAYDPATDREVFLWKDCDTGQWHARFTAGSGYIQYTGTVESDQAFSSVVPVGIESDDLLDYTSDPATISYRLGMVPPWEDGFDFTYPAGAEVCFGVDSPSGTQVLVGAGRTPVSVPFELETLGSCQSEPGAEYNFVVILTDDQRWDTLWAMPMVQDRLVNNGVNFTNAYVPTPLCCPARASLYSGGYLAQNTGILESNTAPNGKIRTFDDQLNLGAELQQAGYHTLFAGKWMIDYPLLMPYVPPGWNKFVGRGIYGLATDWFFFRYLIGSSDQNPGTGSEVDAAGQYQTYFERDQVVNFLDDVPSGKPFFILWSTTSPHAPATPATEDTDLFPTFAYRGRGYDETDFSDKPRWVQNFNPDNVIWCCDEFARDQLRSLQAVDRSVGAIVDKIAAMGQLDNTVFIYTSDNGYMWGEHRLWGKNYAYEESVRVPMVVVMPGIVSRTDNHFVSTVLDIGPTLYDLAGVPHQGDGMSLVPLLQDANTPWRNELFFEKYSTLTWGNGLWAGLRRDQWKYVKYWTGEEELYDLQSDPFELESKHNDSTFSSIRSTMADRTDALLGLAIIPVGNMPKANVGVAYTFQFETWGGQAPFSWQIESGQLPQGLSLDPVTGTVEGVPTSTGMEQFSIRVTDSSVATQVDKARTFVSGQVRITVE